MPHLCAKHQAEWDKTEETTIHARIRTHRAKPKGQERRCITCLGRLGYPLFHLCESCAFRDRLCQMCSASTLTEDEADECEAEAARQEVFDRILDDYTLIIKTYGFRSEVAAAFRAKYPDLDLFSWLPGALDARTDRPVWKEILGPDIWQNPFCERCARERFLHGFRDASECGHTAIGRAYVLCHLCAMRSRRCAACGGSDDHDPA